MLYLLKADIQLAMVCEESTLSMIKYCSLVAKREQNMLCSRNKIKNGNGDDYEIANPNMEENNNTQWFIVRIQSE